METLNLAGLKGYRTGGRRGDAGERTRRPDRLGPARHFSTAGGDTTCGNWTKSGAGSAIVGHHRPSGLKDSRHINSWNSSHGSRGCSQDQLKSSGGAGMIYCFRTN